ncbi:MAG: DNA polymerase I [Gammaproteobacteria bacterium]|nr:DNA polymerase I [Gammaproteobacteria bacterium]
MTTPEERVLLLVDGSSYLYRAFHAMPTLSNSQQQPTGAVYGVINMLRSLLNDYPDAEMAVVFDAKGPTFRDALYSQYKANRAAMPEALRQQIEPIMEIITALGLPLLSVPGVEADDVIGTLAQQAAAAGYQVVISTGDKDLAQLVNGAVTLVNTMDNSRLDVAGVVAKFGVPPERMVDYLTLVGDSVDNVPGVAKVGPKTAVKWLDSYGDLDNLMAHAVEIGGKVGENLRQALPQLPLSRQLVTIKCDVDLPLQLADLRRAEVDRATLQQLYQTLELRSWLRDLLNEPEASPPVAVAAAADHSAAPRHYETITDAAHLQRWIARLQAAACFALDSETTSLNYLDARLVGLSFALVDPESGIVAAYLPLGHRADAGLQLPLAATLAQLRPLLESPDLKKVGQNIKYDAHLLANYGITLAGIADDTMLLSYLIDSSANRHDLESLALKYLGRPSISYEAVTGSGKAQINFADVAIDKASDYACEDAELTLALQQKLYPQLLASGQEALYQTLEIPLITVLQRIERNGVAVDSAMLQQQSKLLAGQLALLEEEAYGEVGHPFNLASPKQLQAILYEDLGLPVHKKTPKGQPSTAEGVLQELALDYRLPAIILEHRSLAKLISTYCDKLPLQVNPATGRIHTSYHQAVAATGRLSSSDPNLQNIPVRSEEGRRIRQAFIAPPGRLLLAADYSQIELRIMAHICGDAALVAAFQQGVDIHLATAAEVFSLPLEAVSRDQRRSAKAINFGLIYGMSAFGLAQQLKIGRAEAQAYIDRYFSRYPGVRHYMEDIREEARQRGYVETIFGRRLYIPDINASNGQRRQYAERTAINAPMQGSAADIIKRAMLAVDSWLVNDAAARGIQMIMQVHDELVFELPADQLDDAKVQIKSLMEQAATLRVPLQVEVGSGANWDAAH